MILSDYSIFEVLKFNELRIIPFPKDKDIQPCSIDFHLGGELKTIDGKTIDILHDTYNIKPKEFLLGCTLEYIEMPKHLCGQVDGKSSIGRLGIFIENAGFIDPNFRGNITLEIYNASDKEFELGSGMSICQLVLFALTSEPSRVYGEVGNHYQDSEGAVLSRYNKEHDMD